MEELINKYGSNENIQTHTKVMKIMLKHILSRPNQKNVGFWLRL